MINTRVSAKEKIREDLEVHIKNFKKRGGIIKVIPSGFSRDGKSYNGEPRQSFNHDSLFHD